MKNNDLICNRFENILGEYVCFHYESDYFPNDPEKPQIKLCGQSLRVRANDAFSKLPQHVKEACVAHELGHREYQHYLVPMDNPFYRMGFVMDGLVLPRELEADRYACSIVGKSKYLKALKDIRTYWVANPLWYSDLAIKELDLRVKELEKTVEN
jgi:hypothetical protein